MSIIETALVFAGIPLAVLLLIVFAVYGRSTLHQPNRYRPGRAWNYPPAWYVPHPDAVDDAVAEVIPTRSAIEDGAPRSGVTAVGGASGEW